MAFRAAPGGRNKYSGKGQGERMAEGGYTNIQVEKDDKADVVLVVVLRSERFVTNYSEELAHTMRMVCAS